MLITTGKRYAIRRIWLLSRANVSNARFPSKWHSDRHIAVVTQSSVQLKLPLVQFCRPLPPEMPSETSLFVSQISGAAELRGRTSKFALEHAVERCFRCIADLGRDLADVRFEDTSISAASLSRHRARYAMGGSPRK